MYVRSPLILVKFGTPKVLLLSLFTPTLRHLLELLILRKNYAIQHAVNKLLVSTIVKNYLSTADKVLLLCRF